MDKVSSRRIKAYSSSPVLRFPVERLLPPGFQVFRSINTDRDANDDLLVLCIDEVNWSDTAAASFALWSRTLRKLFDVDPADYMISICGDEALRELSSPGKSGSFFYLTNDDKYMIKTMKKAEVKVSSFDPWIQTSLSNVKRENLICEYIIMIELAFSFSHANRCSLGCFQPTTNTSAFSKTLWSLNSSACTASTSSLQELSRKRSGCDQQPVI